MDLRSPGAAGALGCGLMKMGFSSSSFRWCRTAFLPPFPSPAATNSSPTVPAAGFLSPPLSCSGSSPAVAYACR